MSCIPDDKIGECVVIGKYPHLFSTPIFFSDPLTHTMNNGTLTITKSAEEITGITCWHVISDYLKALETNQNLIFQIGDNIVNPMDILIDHSEELDLATIRIDKSMLSNMKGKTDPTMGSQQISSTYNLDVKAGDRIFLGGLPGSWVESPKPHFKQFETFSIGLYTVQLAEPKYFICQIDDFNSWPAQEITYKNNRPAKSLLKAGGLSGAPVFIEVKSDSGLTHFELAGIVYEGQFPMQSTSLVLYIRPAKFILPNGKIEHNFADFANYCNTISNPSAEIVEGLLDEITQ